MKSILVVFGTFLFSIFVEGFSRVVIIFYHHTEFSMFGISSFPGTGWVIIIYAAVLATSWLSGMLAVTISGYAPGKHLLSLGVFLLLWRFNEFVQCYGTEPIWYLATIPLSSIIGLILAYKTQQLSNEITTT